jgi:hypothetical protein
MISLWQMSASTSNVAANRLRILALHGFGQNGAILRVKTVGTNSISSVQQHCQLGTDCSQECMIEAAIASVVSQSHRMKIAYPTVLPTFYEVSGCMIGRDPYARMSPQLQIFTLLMPR